MRGLPLCFSRKFGRERRLTVNKKELKKLRDETFFYDIEKIASSTECTGLIPSLPDTEEQDDNYRHLYAIHKGTLPDK